MSIFATIRGLGQSTQDYLNLISQYESANQNVPNYKYGPGFTAQGYYQITNTNWTNIAPQLGIDLSQYPTAMSAPQNVQAQVATYLLTQTPGGISNWSNYNPQLMAALNAGGLQTSGAVTPSNAPSAPLFDLSGSAANTPTSSLMDTLTTDASTVGIDLTNPVVDVVMAAAAALALALFAREVF